jgi:hypothetical protein
MQLQTAERKQAKIKMALQGPTGSGKTKSSLLLAYGLAQDWTKIAIIDSENKSAHFFANLGKYNVLTITPPFEPEKYVEAINHAVRKGMEVIIVDSISAEWEGAGGILDIHASMAGNSYTNWKDVTPRHHEFVQAMLQAPVHVIATIRSKQDYVLVLKDGKQVPEKVGLKGITRDGMDYEFTLLFELDIKHYASAGKDRTEIFMDKPPFKITSETGKQILKWCNEGISPAEEKRRITERINAMKSISDLIDLYNLNPDYQQDLFDEFVKKREQLQAVAKTPVNQISNTKILENGTVH